MKLVLDPPAPPSPVHPTPGLFLDLLSLRLALLNAPLSHRGDVALSSVCLSG